MTEKAKRRRKLSYEILGLFAVCFAAALVLFFFLIFFGIGVAEEYCWENGIPLDEEALYRLDGFVFSVSLAVSVIFFAVLFIVLFGERLAYIGTIIKGVDILRGGEMGYRLPLEGNNELTALAEAINYLSETEAAVKARERGLKEEKEALIRALSHDIRTPLTSIIAYTELLSAKENATAQEMSEYFSLVEKKAGQIKSITEILLDGGKRNVEHFENARLLIEQLVCEFEEALEESFTLKVDISACAAFAGSFDVQEMRRIFDNLISNVQKYAAHEKPVELTVENGERGLTVRQKNAVKKNAHQAQSYKMGLYSILRIAQNYGGGAEVRQSEDEFEIIITLSNL
ncbi:MAG: sensor histidine kinase [Clostridia bacterium]|nr:sensor histidine kinase [Clostridia bacterium]